MAFNEAISHRIKEALKDLPGVEEKHMFGGICYMVNDKMCIGVFKDEMMCRIDPGLYEEALEKTGCRPMDFHPKPMKGYLLVSEEGMKTKTAFDSWIRLCLDFNSKAKASRKKKKT